MSTIYLQDFEPWAALGKLAGMYATHRLGQLNENNMAKGLNDVLGGGGNGQQQAADKTAVVDDGRNGLWNQSLPASQFNAGQYMSNSLRSQIGNGSGGLWGFGQSQNTTPITQAAQATPVAPTPTTAQPIQNSNADTTAAPAAFSSSPSFNQRGGLWGFGQQPQQPQGYFGMVTGNPNFFSDASREVDSTDTDNKTQQDKPGYQVPNKSDIIKDARKRLGADVLTLVKSGMDFKTAKGIAEELYNTDVNNEYTKQANAFSDNVLAPMRNQIIQSLIYTKDKDGNTVVDTYNSSKVKGIAAAVDRYNYYANKIGAEKIDMNNLNSIYALHDDYKFQQMSNGHVARFNMTQGTIDDVGNYAKSNMQQAQNGQMFVMTDDGKIQNLGNFGKKNIKVMNDGTAYMVGADGSMKYVGKYVDPTKAATAKAAQQNAAVRNLVTLHKAWQSSHPGEDESESPYYAKIRTSMGLANPTYSEEEQQQVADRINQLKASGVSSAQIKSELIAKGLNRYADWVPDD